MNKQMFNSWYFVNPEAISRYLFSVLKNWGYYVRWNQSSESESTYLNVNIGTEENPKILCIRISNHSVSPKNCWIMFNFDLYCGHDRKGATNYVNLLAKLAGELNKPMPAGLDKIKAGTIPYKNYRIEMQSRAKNRNRAFTGDRLYV